MGSGIGFVCQQCHYEYEVMLGMGSAYPTVYEEKIREISSGKYGEGRQKVLANTPFAAINAKTVLYVCDQCGAWETGTDVTIYAPNDSDRLVEEQKNKNTGEKGERSYVTEWELRRSYHVIKRYYKKCPGCGKRMHKVSEEELESLNCPKCGTINARDPYLVICWD